MTEKKRKDDINPPEDGEETERTRIGELITAVKEVQHVFQRFSRRIIIFVSVVFLMSASSIAGFAYALHQTKESRIEASENRCEATNKSNEFIRSIIIRFRVITQAELDDGVPIESDCHKYAVDATK